MDKATKFFKKLPKRDLQRIRAAIEMLKDGKVEGIKLSTSDTYRFPVGIYRIFYKKQNNKKFAIDVKRGDEKIYKN